jgi:hypothetical protein
VVPSLTGSPDFKNNSEREVIELIQDHSVGVPEGGQLTAMISSNSVPHGTCGTCLLRRKATRGKFGTSTCVFLQLLEHSAKPKKHHGQQDKGISRQKPTEFLDGESSAQHTHPLDGDDDPSNPLFVLSTPNGLLQPLRHIHA